MTSPDDDHTAPWTEAGRERYLARVEALVEDLRRHARLVAALDEEHFDHDPDTRRTVWASEGIVREAVGALAEAELGWTGTTSLPLPEEDEDSAGLGVVGGLDELPEELRPAGDVLSLVGRWDVDLVDPERFLAAGRAAYARRHGLSDPALAEANVTDALEAAAALLEMPSWPELEVPGASIALGAYWQYVVHDEPLSEPGEPDEADPFDIVRDDD